MKSWKYKQQSLSIETQPDTLQEIIDGKIPALQIKNFFSPHICDKIVSKVSNHSVYDHGSSKLKKVGIFLSAYLNKKEKYFPDAEISNKKISKIFSDTEDPIEKINQVIHKISKIENIIPATEQKNDYSHGIFRIWENSDFGPLHRDYANFEAPNFQISRHENQLSCVLFLQNPTKGGELVIHNKKWEKPDEKFRAIDFGYSREVIKEVSYEKILPQKGDLIIFNPRFFHEILPTIGKTNRVTFGFFIGFSNQDNFAEYWS